jgi:5'-AMP-activated protein kinase catalytic alpha subunit
MGSIGCSFGVKTIILILYPQPENLLLDTNGELKISDFGLSALHNNINEGMTLTSSKFLHTTCGSPNYVSPEVIDSEGCGYDGRKADVWSMGECDFTIDVLLSHGDEYGDIVSYIDTGVILYVMSTGSLPFDEKSMPELFAKIRAANYRPPRGISPSLVDLISRILVANPKKRVSLEEIQRHEWYIGSDDI